MSSLTIGLSGLKAAQYGLELVGTNIANAATEGYHRQDLQLAPTQVYSGPNLAQGGVRVERVVRGLDRLLEAEILRQQPQLGQTTQELSGLRTLQAAMGELDENGLDASITQFFTAVGALAQQPESRVLREQVIREADAMAGRFRSLGSVMGELQQHVMEQAGEVVGQVNRLTAEIAELNVQIERVNSATGQANLLLDRRDQALKELGELVDIQTSAPDRESNLTASAWGIPLVMGRTVMPLAVSRRDDGKLAVSAGDADVWRTDLEGGRLGGLLSLANDLVSGFQDDLDALAGELITQINQLHVGGVGGDGPFDSLDGWTVGEGPLADWASGVAAGDLYVRVTNLATGQVTQTRLAIDPATQMAADVADLLDGVAGLTASIVDRHLHVEGDAGFAFDFRPALPSGPTTSTLTGASSPAVSGLYTAGHNDVFSFTVGADGTVGVTDHLTITVRNQAGELVRTIDVGAGYAPGDRIEIADGVKVALSAGTLNSGESFTVRALWQSDTAGVLAALGVNTFFAGDSAEDMAVCQRLLDDPMALAAAAGSDGLDNLVLRRMAELGESPATALGGLSPADWFNSMAVGLGQGIVARQARLTALESVQGELTSQRDSVSGVDVNEQAARMLSYEQMFQAMARFVATHEKTMTALLEMV